MAKVHFIDIDSKQPNDKELRRSSIMVSSEGLTVIGVLYHNSVLTLDYDNAQALIKELKKVKKTRKGRLAK